MRTKRPIIGRGLLWALVLGVTLATAGCSALRLAYGQAPNLAYWWVDSFVDLDGAQTSVVRRGLDDWFAWHRRSELPAYVALLEEVQAEAAGDTTAARACGWWGRVQQHRDAALRQAAAPAAELALLITPAQVRHLEREFAKRNDKAREEFLRDNEKERAEATLERAVERAESIYGPLDAAQQAWLGREITRSPWEPGSFLAERERRQQRLIALVKPWTARNAKPAPEQARREVQQLLETWYAPPDEAARRAQAQLIDFNCRLFAQLHNRTTPAQRRVAAEKIGAWLSDLRSVQSGAAPG